MNSAFNTKYSTLKQSIPQKQYKFLKQYERISLKSLKLVLDNRLLNKCKLCGKIPLFISKNFRKFSYKTFLIQNRILHKEIKQKEKLLFKFDLEKGLLKKNKLFQYFNQSFTLDIFQNWNLILTKFLKRKRFYYRISF